MFEQTRRRLGFAGDGAGDGTGDDTAPTGGAIEWYPATPASARGSDDSERDDGDVSGDVPGDADAGDDGGVWEAVGAPDVAPPRERTPRVRLAQLAAMATGGRPCPQAGPDEPPEHTSGPVRRTPFPHAVVPSLVQRRRGAVVVALAGIVAVAGLTAVILSGRPDPERPPPLPAAHDAPAAAPRENTSTAPAATTEPLVVSVVGRVAKPGLITVPPGARVADAIREAGGAARDADLLTVNLARKLADGEQLYVGVPVPPGVMTGSGAREAGAAAVPDGKVNLNTASTSQLETLSGVGEVTAQRIVEWRDEHGPFTSVEQLRQIDGIGDKKLERLRDEVTVG